MDADWSQALMWDSRLLFVLVNEPALVAINVHHHYKTDWNWPARTSWPFSWFYGTRASLHLPKPARLRGPYSVGGSGGLNSDFEGLVLVNSDAPGASLHVYAVDPSRGSYDGANDMALVWQVDLKPAVQAAIDSSGLIAKASSAVIVSMTVSDPSVLVSIQLAGRGMAVELWLNGTLRWASGILAMVPDKIETSQTGVAVAIGGFSNENPISLRPGRDQVLTAFWRDSGAEFWTASCVECIVEMIDNRALLVIDQPLIAIESLRMLEISTGKILWHAEEPRGPLFPTFCGLPSLTATDIILACDCDYKNISAPKLPGGKCLFAYRITSGKIHWATLISSRSSSTLPQGLVEYELRPKIYHGNEELAIVGLSDELVAVKTGQGEIDWRFELPDEQRIVGWNHFEVRAGLLIFRTTSASAAAPQDKEDEHRITSTLDGRLFALDPDHGTEVWRQPASLSFPPSPPQAAHTALAPPGIIVLDSCAFFDSHTDDIQCCLDAYTLVTGDRLWTQCLDQSSACDLAERRALLSTCIEWILLIQVLAVLGMLFFVCFRSCLVCLLCSLSWLPAPVRGLRPSPYPYPYHGVAEGLLVPEDVEGGSGDLEGGSGGSKNWDGVPFLMRGGHAPIPSAPISSHELVLAWMETGSDPEGQEDAPVLDEADMPSREE